MRRIVLSFLIIIVLLISACGSTEVSPTITDTAEHSYSSSLTDAVVPSEFPTTTVESTGQVTDTVTTETSPADIPDDETLTSEFIEFAASNHDFNMMDYMSNEPFLMSYDDGSYSILFQAKDRGSFPSVCLFVADANEFILQKNLPLEDIRVSYSDVVNKDGGLM